MVSSKKNSAENNPEATRTATDSTRGNPDDPRWKSADNLEKDNEEKLGEHLDPKHEKTGG